MKNYLKSWSWNLKNATPLHYAGTNRNNVKEIGRILISKGGDINGKDVISSK